MVNPPEALLVVHCKDCGKSIRIASTTVSYICYCLNSAVQPKKKSKLPHAVEVTKEQRAEAKRLEVAAAKRASAATLVAEASGDGHKKSKPAEPSSPFKRAKKQKDKEAAKVAKKQEKKTLKRRKILSKLFAK